MTADRDPIRSTADRVLAQMEHPEPRWPSAADLGALARDWIARANAMAAGRAHRLGQAGQIVVSTDAARKYAGHADVSDLDAARRELTALLIDAHETQTAGDWRLSRRTGPNIEARVLREMVADHELLVVTDVFVRGGSR